MIATLVALAEPNRLRIVELLRDGPQAVGEISARLQLRQPQASKHLKVLKGAGLVGVRPVAQQRLYELRATPFQALQEWLEGYRSLWSERFDEVDRVIEEIQRKERGQKP